MGDARARGWWRQALAVPARAALALAALFALMPATADAQTRALPDPEAAAVAPQPESKAENAAADAAQTPLSGSLAYKIRFDRWTEADERGYGEFVQAIGDSKCHNVNACVRGAHNPFRNSDPQGVRFYADCADLPYFLRAYYAWKRGLPFSYAASVAPRGRTRDIRYTARGNKVVDRRDILTGSTTGLDLLNAVRGVSSAMYRIHPDIDGPPAPDHYSVAIEPKSIRPGTVVYDPNGHLAVVYRIEPDGRIRYIDAHPDNSLTRGTYDRRFVRARPGMGAGFKNWRPLRLTGATRAADGSLVGGRIVATKNAEISDYSTEQFYGSAKERPEDDGWESARFVLNGEGLDYYDYVRAKLGGGSLHFDPLQEVRNMVRSNCDDLHYRAEAVDLAIAAGVHRKSQPSRLPSNIYGTEGEWEVYSTPSRDARLKTAFKELRDQVERFVTLHAKRDKKIVYTGSDLVGDLLRVYDVETAKCNVGYTRSDGSRIGLSYEEVRKRLFKLDFDPYHCVERRWGATGEQELATCSDGELKGAWYDVLQPLRNQLDRTYEARMDFTLSELKTPGAGKGVAEPPDVDVRGYLLVQRGQAPTPLARGAAIRPDSQAARRD